MNTQLVRTLAQIISSLSPEEKQLLETELQPKTDWNIIQQSILERGEAINERLNNQSLSETLNEWTSQADEEAYNDL